MERSLPLTDFSDSAEATILRLVIAMIRADAKLVANFSPIQLAENPSMGQLTGLTIGSMVVTPTLVTPQGKPSGRETEIVEVNIFIVLGLEDLANDSQLSGLNVGAYLRALFASNLPLRDGNGVEMAYAVPDFTELPVEIDGSIQRRVFRFRIRFQTDIKLTTGQVW
jgi:hypothetical protein